MVVRNSCHNFVLEQAVVDNWDSLDCKVALALAEAGILELDNAEEGGKCLVDIDEGDTEGLVENRGREGSFVAVH